MYPVFIPMQINGHATWADVLGSVLAIGLIGGGYLIKQRLDEWRKNRDRIASQLRYEAKMAALAEQRVIESQKETEHRTELMADAERRRRNWLIDRVEEQVK
jgi:hypothetical protein